MTDAQRELIAPVLHQALGRCGRTPRRQLLNGIFYVLHTGCQWRYLLKSYPNYSTVYSAFRRWSADGTWDKIINALRVEMRYSQGRSAYPCAAIVDTQSVKTTEKGALMALTEPS